MAVSNKNFYSICDRAHFLGASTLILASFIPRHSLKFSLTMSFLVILFAAIKEGFWDPKYESREIAGSGWRDFIFYCYGVLFALSICCATLILCPHV